MGSGIGVTAFGIADDKWATAVAEQAGKLQHMSNLYYTEPCVELGEVLCKRTSMKKVFFSNSGAEANECAIKVARKYAAEKKGSDYYTIITLKNSFHGRTITTLAAIVVIIIVSEIMGLTSLRTFAIQLSAGLIFGAYSSICLAPTIWVKWKEKQMAKAASAPKSKKK